jgi:hypothetical protein
MSDAAIFETTCRELQRATSLDELASRGTMRLALKSAGLDTRTVTGAQMIVVLRRVLPGELASRGVANAEEICSRLAASVAGLAEPAASPSGRARASVEEVFKRLGGS